MSLAGCVHDSVPVFRETDTENSCGGVEELSQTEVSRLSAGSVDNIPPRPGTCNGAQSTKALLPFVQGEIGIVTYLTSCVVRISCCLLHNLHLYVSYFSHLSRLG